MTTDLLIALGKANIAAGAAILAIIAVRKLVRGAFGARLAYALWLAVPLAAIAVLLPARTTVLPQAPVTFVPVDSAPVFARATDIASVAFTAAPAPLDLTMIAVWLWIAGAVVVAGWLMRKQAAFMADARIGKAGPAVVGVLRPRIVTPSNFAKVFSDGEQAVVLAHETMHIARQDVRANALAALAQCACWFNPLIHIAAFLMRIDQELACDAQVVERHPKARRTYGEAMLKAELAGRPLPLGCCWPAGSQHPLTERMAMLKQDRPSRRRRLTGAASIAALCAIGGLTAWAAQPERIEYAPPETPQPAPVPQSGFVPVPKLVDRTEPVSQPGFVPVPKPADQAEPLPQPGFVPVPQPGFVPVPKPVDRTQPVPQRIPNRLEPLKPAPTSQQVLPTHAILGRKPNHLWGPVSISGTITDVKWVNPNAQIYVHGDDGTDWYVLSSPPDFIFRSGGSPDIIRKGVTIKLDGLRAIDGFCKPLCLASAWETDMTFNGKKLEPAPAAPQPVPTSFEPAPEPQQPAPISPQQLPRYAPLGHGTKEHWVSIAISGTITDVKWFNPNVQIFIHGDDGKDWYVLTSTPNHVKRSGGSPGIIKKNVRITLDGQRALEACEPLCVAMAWETDMTFDGAKLTPQ